MQHSCALAGLQSSTPAGREAARSRQKRLREHLDDTPGTETPILYATWCLLSLWSVSHVEVAGCAWINGLPHFLHICAGQHVQPGRQCNKVKLSPPPRIEFGGSSVCDHGMHAGQAALSDQGVQGGNVPQHAHLHKEGQQIGQTGEERAALNTAVPGDNIAASVKRNRRAASHRCPRGAGSRSRVRSAR